MEDESPAPVDSVVAPAYALFSVREESVKPLQVKVRLDQKDVVMEVDTGASLSLISEVTLNQVWEAGSAPELQPCDVKLRSYTGEEIPVKGTITVSVQHGEQRQELPLLVVRGGGPSLLGRDWLDKLPLDWREIFRMQSGENLPLILARHAEIFTAGQGTLRGVKVKLYVDEEVQPKFCKARSVPFALRQRVEEELERLERDGIIEPIQFSDWAAPIVPVMKRDGKVRICGDYKLTVNRAAKLEVYPLPRIEDIFASLAGGKTFSKLDLSHAYQQLVLDDQSRELVAINTHKGLYRYNRLAFGVSSAPAIFQRVMEGLLKGVPKVSIYLDDILVTGDTEEEHLRNLEEVLQRLRAAGMKLKREKCSFMMPQVEYLGHVINKDGLQPSESKVRAITEAPVPRNTTELRSLLGLVNYYGRFLANLSSKLAPLYALLQAEVPFVWGASQSKAFQEVKEALRSSQLLVHFDSNLPLGLSCDASPYGLGAVLSHRFPDGSERPIGFVSRTLATAERNYSQIEKEGLAIVFGVKRYHQYLYGRHFVILSDHKPLKHLFSESRAVPPLASARIQRWALTLAAYDYVIEYRAGKDHANADAFSRLPLPEAPVDIPVPQETVLLMEQLATSPVSAAQIRSFIDKDPLLSKVKKFVQSGWPSQEPEEGPEILPYRRRKEELSLEDGCLLWGRRVIIPPQARTKVLIELHEAHPGIVRMKTLARVFAWWPGIDVDLEKKVRECATCQAARKTPSPSPLQTWQWEKRPWARIHADYAGPFLGQMFLIMIDSHSKWLEVHPTNGTTSAITIEKMRGTFASLGLPEVIVTDNATAFTSEEFKEFVTRNGIRHITSPPYHPASNGLAERAVQTFKEGIKKMATGSLQTKLARFLFQYRITPQATTATSPAELLMGRRLRSPLDMLYPDLESRVQRNQDRQCVTHDAHARMREVQVGEAVYARNFGRGPKWSPGVVVDIKGPASVWVELLDGCKVRRHIDHVRSRTAEGPDGTSDTDIPLDAGPTVVPTAATAEGVTGTPSSAAIGCPRPVDSAPPAGDEQSEEPRRSQRVCRPPTRYTPSDI